MSYQHIILKDDKVIMGEGYGNTQQKRFFEINEDTLMDIEAFMIYVVWDDFVEMNQIYVGTQHRQKGLGHKLFDVLEDKAVSIGRPCIKIRIMIDESNGNPMWNLLTSRKYQPKLLDVALPELGREIWYKKL